MSAQTVGLLTKGCYADLSCSFAKCVQVIGLCPRRLSVCLYKGCYADLPAHSPCACRLMDDVRADWRSAYNDKAAMQTFLPLRYASAG